MLKLIKIFLICIFFLSITTNLIGETRYVSKTGGVPTPPYTSWATACDSMQKCFDYCVTGDTVYVDRGIYRETIYILDKDLTIIGVDTDECIIDGTGIEGLHNYWALFEVNNLIIVLKNLTFKKKDLDGNIYDYGVCAINSFCCIENCIIDSTHHSLYMDNGGRIGNVIIKNAHLGIRIYSTSDLSTYSIGNCIIQISSRDSFPGGLDNAPGGGNFNINNNIFIFKPILNTAFGLSIRSNQKVKINNNIFYGFRTSILAAAQQGTERDTTYIINNTFTNSYSYGIETGNMVKHYIIKNNIFANTGNGIYSYGNPGDVDYNMMYNIPGTLYHNLPAGAHDTIADPMFVNDTAVVLGGTYNYRLQKFSPAIDRGDPNILDVDGSRSDLGMFGGPFGESYLYQNLAPKPVKGFNAVYQQDTNRVKLTWKPNTESDFKQYYIYKDITANFTIDSTKRIGVLTDTLYYNILTKGTQKVYYKVTAIDSTGNESRPRTEVNVTITENEETIITENYSYQLYQNYPNPFNPSTTISYSLKDPGEVRIKLYTVTGELIKTIIEGSKNKGYNETKIDMSNYTSGIYLYRLEVTGAGKIPVFNDLKKMVFVK